MINDKIVRRPLRTSDGISMTPTLRGELSQIFRHSYNHVSLNEFLSNPELRQRLANNNNETDVDAYAKLRLATNLLEDIFSYVLPEHAEAHRIEVWKDKIDFHKCQWPCHGLPDYINNISFEIGRDGDLIDYELFKVDPSGEEISESWDWHTIDGEIDEAFISSLFDDAKKFSTFAHFGSHTSSTAPGQATIHHYGEAGSIL